MAAPKGHPRYGGRGPGTPNKRRSIYEVCDALGLDPFAELAKIAQSSAEEGARLAALRELCQYLEPKKKALEHSGELNNPFAHLTLEELQEMNKKKLEE